MGQRTGLAGGSRRHGSGWSRQARHASPCCLRSSARMAAGLIWGLPHIEAAPRAAVTMATPRHRAGSWCVNGTTLRFSFRRPDPAALGRHPKSRGSRACVGRNRAIQEPDVLLSHGSVVAIGASRGSAVTGPVCGNVARRPGRRLLPPRPVQVVHPGPPRPDPQSARSPASALATPTWTAGCATPGRARSSPVKSRCVRSRRA